MSPSARVAAPPKTTAAIRSRSIAPRSALRVRGSAKAGSVGRRFRTTAARVVEGSRSAVGAGRRGETRGGRRVEARDGVELAGLERVRERRRVIEEAQLDPLDAGRAIAGAARRRRCGQRVARRRRRRVAARRRVDRGRRLEDGVVAIELRHAVWAGADRGAPEGRNPPSPRPVCRTGDGAEDAISVHFNRSRVYKWVHSHDPGVNLGF